LIPPREKIYTCYKETHPENAIHEDFVGSYMLAANIVLSLEIKVKRKPT